MRSFPGHVQILIFLGGPCAMKSVLMGAMNNEDYPRDLVQWFYVLSRRQGPVQGVKSKQDIHINFKIQSFLLHLYIFSLQIKIKMYEIYTASQCDLQIFSRVYYIVEFYVVKKTEMLKFSRCHI